MIIILSKKNSLLFRCLTSKQCTALKPTASSPTCSPQLTPPGITQVSHRWVRCSFLFGSDEMIFQICGLLGLVRRRTCALDRTCPVIKVNSERSSSLILFWFLTLCSFSTILFQLPSACWCVRVLLESWSSDDCCQIYYWKCRKVKSEKEENEA